MFIYILLIVLPLHAYASCTMNLAFDNPDTLRESIDECLSTTDMEGHDNMNTWDVSQVPSMVSEYTINGPCYNEKTQEHIDCGMFQGLSAFNADISNWDVSSVTNMNNMFSGATAFNGDLSKWDVSKVTSSNLENNMFLGAEAFNGDISSWVTTKMTSMKGMFHGATSFNGDISNWDVSNVLDMSQMFEGATAFDGDLSKWQLSDTMIHGWLRADNPYPGASSHWSGPTPSDNLYKCRQEHMDGLSSNSLESQCLKSIYCENSATSWNKCYLRMQNMFYEATAYQSLPKKLCGKWKELAWDDFGIGFNGINNVLWGNQWNVNSPDFNFENYGWTLIGTDATCTCPSGTFGQMPNCPDCAVGYYTNQPNSTECKACAVGKFQDVAGSTSCKYCDDGQWTGLKRAQSTCVTVPDTTEECGVLRTIYSENGCNTCN